MYVDIGVDGNGCGWEVKKDVGSVEDVVETGVSEEPLSVHDEPHQYSEPVSLKPLFHCSSLVHCRYQHSKCEGSERKGILSRNGTNGTSENFVCRMASL